MDGYVERIGLALVALDAAHHAEQAFGQQIEVQVAANSALARCISKHAADHPRKMPALGAIAGFLRARQPGRIAQQHEELAAVPEKGHRLADDGGKPFLVSFRIGQRRLDLSPKLPEALDHRGRVQLFLGSELAVDAAFADAGVQRNIIGQNFVKALFAEQFGGAANYALAQHRDRPPAAFALAAGAAWGDRDNTFMLFDHACAGVWDGLARHRAKPATALPIHKNITTKTSGHQSFRLRGACPYDAYASCARADSQQCAGASANHMFGHAAQEKSFDSAAVVGRDDDEVGPEPCGLFHDGARGVSNLHENLGLKAPEPRIRHLFELSPGILLSFDRIL